MTDNSWAFELDNKILTIVKTKLTSKFSEKFPDLTVTSVVDSNNLTQFPTIHLRQIGSSEVGSDLESDTVNAVLYTEQADIYINTSQNDARKVANETANIFKSLRFRITIMPEFGATDNVHRVTIRASRIIGANERIGE